MRKILILSLLLCFAAPIKIYALSNNHYVQQYIEKDYQYQPFIQDYKINNDYLNFSTAKEFKPEKFTWDENGIPMVKYGTRIEYNPVTTAQGALFYHGKFLTSQRSEDREAFLKLADALIKMQSKDGAFRYSFSHRIPHLKTRYPAGWVSGMAQGQALSVFSRAYEVTKDIKYKLAGNASFNFLTTPVSKGGTMTDLSHISSKWKDQIWFEEYVTSPKNNYTLNGYIYTLLGLYDWGYNPEMASYGGEKAKILFQRGQDSVKKILLKYDVGGYTAYDLSHLTLKQEPHVVIEYHRVHISQMYVMYRLTGSKYFLEYYNRWKSYVDPV
ncbi:D-glucuronyl C5-epimerase family protein [Metabacillus sp. KIGAM252]|uniref:D-glucuronyl C5-epimerase family protein n=1 Tax=Metabacillus flavus TaxID=2823519 RepID=A0ABS5LJ24_9BACI|nr:D-glucuronyl C5-epimerase family protein [Metabacillus flavus]MBS2970723.1 D-glucuronyl C5-epimerase family protein [Metabacillus flavus]